MELKAKLNKPYTEKQKTDFIVKQNHDKGYEIKETETALEAWGYTEDEIEKQEQEQINNLSMTPLDFIKSLQSLGLTLNEINTYLENNLEIKMQLTYCQNVYLGVVKQLCPITVGEVEITSDIVEELFKNKNGDT